MMPGPHARWEDRRAIVSSIVLLLISLHLIWQVWLVTAAAYPAHYDYDEGVYAETAAAAAAGQRLYASVFLSQPPLLIGILAHVFGTFHPSLAAGRGVLVDFSVLWLASLAAIAARSGRPRAAVWAVAAAVSAPAVVLASHTVQMEPASEALAALAVALGLAAGGISGTGRSARLAWTAAGAAAGFAVMTKFTAATCLVPLGVALASAERPSARRAVAGAAAIAGGGLLAAGATVAWTASPPIEMWRQAVDFHAAVARATALDPGGTAVLLRQFAAANWFLVGLGLAGLGSARARYGRVWHAAVAWLAADLAAVFLLRPLWPHHLVILAAPLAVLAAAAVETVWSAVDRMERGRRIAAGLLAVCWLAAVAGAAASAVPANSGSLRAVVLQTRRLVPGGGWVVTDDPMVPFLAGRDTPPALCDTSEMRMRAASLTAGTLTAALGDARVRGVVLWRGTFRRQFPQFAGAASSEFPRRWTAGDGREILAR